MVLNFLKIKSKCQYGTKHSSDVSDLYWMGSILVHGLTRFVMSAMFICVCATGTGTVHI